MNIGRVMLNLIVIVQLVLVRAGDVLALTTMDDAHDPITLANMSPTW